MHIALSNGVNAALDKLVTNFLKIRRSGVRHPPKTKIMKALLLLNYNIPSVLNTISSFFIQNSQTNVLIIC